MKFLMTLLVLCTLHSALVALPKYVIIIRHAEKQSEGYELSLKGRERAEALAPFFMGNDLVTGFGVPNVIFAQTPSAAYPSMRSFETVAPLAKALKVSIHKEFEHLQYPQLVETIKKNPAYDGKVVLICWEHHVIPEIAKLFGAKNVPEKWHGDVFDRIWVVGFHSEGEVTFKDFSQRLMFGDSSS